MTSRPRVVPAALEFALLRGAIEEIPLGVATTRGNEILYANNALERLYGAPPGGLDGKDMTALFDVETLRHLTALLDKRRLYDGRVRARGFDGRAIYAELHAERYNSEAYGVGGFLVMRDVSLELGALGRLLDALGGVHIHVRTDDGKIEFVSPSIATALGVGVEEARSRPECVLDRIAPEERERLAFLYRRMTTGEMLNASAQVAIKQKGGAVAMMSVRATGRRDTAGDVSHIDAVIFPVQPPEPKLSGRHPAANAEMPNVFGPESETPPHEVALARADLVRELLRETSQQLQLTVQETRTVRQVFTSSSASVPGWLVTEIASGLQRVGDSSEAALAITRRARRGLEGKRMSQPLRELLDGVNATLTPILPAKRLTMSHGDLAQQRVDEHGGELALVLVYLGLRAFRLAGSGVLGVRTNVLDDHGDRFARIELLAEAQDDENLEADVSTDVTLLTRQAEFDKAFAGVEQLLAALGAEIESDEATLERARTVLKVPIR